MAKRLDPRQAAKLARVQSVRKAASEASLVAARDAEAAAASLRALAQDDAEAASEQWLAHVSAGSFQPEWARHLAMHQVARDSDAAAAATALNEAAETHLRRQGDWRAAAVRVELADALHKAARRDAATGRDERRMAGLSDRITFAWVKA